MTFATTPPAPENRSPPVAPDAATTADYAGWSCQSQNPDPAGSARVQCPAARTGLARAAENSVTSVTTSRYPGCCCMDSGVPCICIRHTGTPSRAASSTAPGACSALTSLISPAPAATAACMTSGLRVSIDTGTASTRSQGLDHRDHPSQLFIDGNRCRTGAGGLTTDIDNGRPSSTMRSAWSTACSGAKKSPPSEKESGVILRMPMTCGRDRSSDLPAQSMVFPEVTAVMIRRVPCRSGSVCPAIIGASGKA